MPHMWTPLILICMIGRPDCAIPAAPGYLSKKDCQTALAEALATYTAPPNARVVLATCYEWGTGT